MLLLGISSITITSLSRLIVDFVVTSSYVILSKASASGWYLSHSESRYFYVAKINQGQLEDCASRKGASVEQAE